MLILENHAILKMADIHKSGIYKDLKFVSVGVGVGVSVGVCVGIRVGVGVGVGISMELPHVVSK
jgi:hypothetical protein